MKNKTEKAQIALERIIKQDNRVQYSFTYTDELARFFSDFEFVIEYPESIEDVPDAILSIPFAVNVLPIAWLTDSTLFIPYLDKDFYESIPNFKKGYANMYPEAAWLGEVVADNIVDCTRDDINGSAAFFSGGLDATTTLMLHYEEKPELFVLWGADVKYDNAKGWAVMEKGLSDAAALHDLPLYVIHTSFREFDNEGVLHGEFYPILKDGWWHGVKHSIGIIGQAAPLMWLHKLKTLYIASTFTSRHKNVRCASYPTIDENVSFCGCNVVHDGFEFNRQEKTHFVVKRKDELNVPVLLKVCWESQAGNNCSKCEKCYRTMVGLWVEGADPADYGFDFDINKVFDEIYDLIAIKSPSVPSLWNNIKDKLIDNWEVLKNDPCAKKLAWIKDFDFEHLESNRCRKRYNRRFIFKRVKAKLAKKCPWLLSAYHKVTHKN